MEDFVPYETVLKLEKKGYKCKTIRYHGHIYDVLKWLRETHNLYIVPFINDDTEEPIIFEVYKETECLYHHSKYYSLKDWDKANIAGIEYVIDNNLI